MGYLPDYLFGSGPGWFGSLLIVVATAAAWFSVSRLERRPRLIEPAALMARRGATAGTTGYLPAFNPHAPAGAPPAPSRGPATAVADPPPAFAEAAPTRPAVPRWVATWAWPIALTVGAYIFASIVAAGSAGRVAALGRTESFSVGIFQQALWWTGHGVPMGATFATSDASLHRLFGLHFSPLLAALSPLYRLRPEASTLLWIQAAMMGLAALPLYAAARLRIGKMGAGLVAVAWLLHPTVVGTPLLGFHALAFAPFFAFTAFWALLKRRWFFYMLALVALLLIREDLAFFVVLMGFVASAQKAESRFVSAPLLTGAAWLAACLIWIMPHYRTPALAAGSNALLAEHFIPWGATLGSLINEFISRPLAVVGRIFSRESFAAVASILRPAGFLLPIPDAAWISGLEKLFVNVAAESARLKGVFAESSIIVTAAFFMALPGALGVWGRWLGGSGEVDPQFAGTLEERGAAVRVAARLGDLWKSRRAAPAAGAPAGRTGAPAAAIAVIAGLLALFLMRIDRQFAPAPRADLADQLLVLSAVPDSVSVLAPDYAYARLANRSRVSSLGSLDGRALEPEILDRFDAVVLDMAPGSTDLKDYPDVVNGLETRIRGSHDFRETLSAGGLHLFERLKAF